MDIGPISTFAAGRIKEIRKARGLNQTELADLINRTQRTVSRYEAAMITISVDVLYAIACALQQPIEYFFPPLEAPSEQPGSGLTMPPKRRTHLR